MKYKFVPHQFKRGGGVWGYFPLKVQCLLDGHTEFKGSGYSSALGMREGGGLALLNAPPSPPTLSSYPGTMCGNIFVKFPLTDEI